MQRSGTPQPQAQSVDNALPDFSARRRVDKINLKKSLRDATIVMTRRKYVCRYTGNRSS